MANTFLASNATVNNWKSQSLRTTTNGGKKQYLLKTRFHLACVGGKSFQQWNTGYYLENVSHLPQSQTDDSMLHLYFEIC